MKTKEKKHKHKWGEKFTNSESKSYYKSCKCGVVLELPKPKEKPICKLAECHCDCCVHKPKEKKVSWRIDLVAVEFQGKKKISEKIIKKT